MIVKLLSFKPNKDGSVTLYIDKGADLHSLIDMTGKEIVIDIPLIKELLNESILSPLFERSGALLRDAYELGKSEEQARHDLPAPEGE